MNDSTPVDWLAANQRYLAAALAEVREALARHAGRSTVADCGTGADPPGDAVRQAVLDAAARLPAPAALDTLCGAFGLSPFERDLLLLCAGIELDSQFATLCAAAQGDPLQGFPDLQPGAGRAARAALERPQPGRTLAPVAAGRGRSGPCAHDQPPAG